MNRKSQPLLPQKYTEEVLRQMEKQFTPEECFAACDMRMRQLEKNDKESFVERGLIVLTVERRELYKPLYKSLGAWLMAACPYSRTTAYAALQEVKRAVSDGISLDDANEMPRCNLKIVNRLSTSIKKDPEIIAAAKHESENGFIGKVQKKYPTQHLEPIAPYRFRPEASQRKKIDAAIEAVTLLNPETTRREDCLEVLAVEYLENHEVELRKAMAKAARA